MKELVHFHTSNEMKYDLDRKPQYRDKLYCRGFLICDSRNRLSLDQYPFYGNWKEIALSDKLNVFIHKDTNFFIHSVHDSSVPSTVFFLIGHAYNPFTMQYKEEEILADLAIAYEERIEAFWKKESELTGVFCLGYVDGDEIVATTDCCGMQVVNYGLIDGKIIITSHAKIASDLYGLEQDPYIRKLINTKVYKYWGTWLPGDLTAFKELKRLQPNCNIRYCCTNTTEDAGDDSLMSAETEAKCNDVKLYVERYYPFESIPEVSTEEEYNKLIDELTVLMQSNMKLISDKWADKVVAVSVSGGRDSMTTYACSKGLYDKFKFFSYISNYAEEVDTIAAQKICEAIGTNHSTYVIPDDCEEYRDLELFRKILECNHACIGHNNENDVKKRLWFSNHCDFDIEVKSWVNEMGRGWYYNKYKKKSFPRRPDPALLRSIHKIYLNPELIRRTNTIFRNFMEKYYVPEFFDGKRWLDFFMWEFSWSGGEGMSLNNEHKTTYDITVPFNNRYYVEKMIMLPLDKRINDNMPVDIIERANSKINELNTVVKDISHTDLRAYMVKTYLWIFKHFKREG